MAIYTRECKTPGFFIRKTGPNAGPVRAMDVDVELRQHLGLPEKIHLFWEDIIGPMLLCGSDFDKIKSLIRRFITEARCEGERVHYNRLLKIAEYMDNNFVLPRPSEV